jgi:hypothetical protein
MSLDANRLTGDLARLMPGPGVGMVREQSFRGGAGTFELVTYEEP